MEFFIISMLNGLSYGLLLFMLSSGLTLIFSMMGVLNFAHASFYMVGAYVGYSASQIVGFWPALVIAPLVVGALGALFERIALRKVHKFGHVPELLVTFGLSYVLLELVQLIWGRLALEFRPPEILQGPAFTLINHSINGLSVLWGVAPAEMCSAADAAVRVVCSPFPATRGFMMLVALVMLGSVWLLLTRTRIGLVIQAALTHPHMVGWPPSHNASHSRSISACDEQVTIREKASVSSRWLPALNRCSVCPLNRTVADDISSPTSGPETISPSSNRPALKK